MSWGKQCLVEWRDGSNKASPHGEERQMKSHHMAMPHRQVLGKNFLAQYHLQFFGVFRKSFPAQMSIWGNFFKFLCKMERDPHFFFTNSSSTLFTRQILFRLVSYQVGWLSTSPISRRFFFFYGNFSLSPSLAFCLRIVWLLPVMMSLQQRIWEWVDNCSSNCS